jgi:hypothetical protein
MGVIDQEDEEEKQSHLGISRVPSAERMRPTSRNNSRV